MPTDKGIQELILRLDAKLLERIDDFRFKYRFASRIEAIRWLLDAALKSGKKPKPEP